MSSKQQESEPLDRRHLPPADYHDPVIEAYMQDVDVTLLRENLKLTVDERIRKFENFMRFISEAKGAARKSQSSND